LQVTQFTENWYECLHFLLQSVGNVCEIFCSAEWFQKQKEFTIEIENMEVNELKKSLAKFYVSVRKTNGSYYN